VILISLFSILILILLPILYLIMRRLELNLQKYQFWVMAGTGISWLTSIASFLISPEYTLNLIWNVGFQLLPGSIIRLDPVSTTLIMAQTSIIFAAALFQEYSPKQLAWITGLGGVCCLAMLADTPFTLLLILTLIEIVLLFNFITSEIRFESTRRKLLAVIGRLLSPFLMLYAMLKGGAQFSESTFSEIDPSAGPILIAAGLIGALGWFAFLRDPIEESPDLIPNQITESLPTTIGLLLMIRGAGLMASNPIDALPGFVPGLITLILVLVSTFLFRLRSSWYIGLLGVIAGAAIIGNPQGSMTWSLVLLLPGFILAEVPENPKQNLLFLIIGGIGMISAPFLPAWTGIEVFNPGIGGYLFAGALGLAGGRFLGGRISDLVKISNIKGAFDLPRLLAAFCLLVCQYIFAIKIGLIPTSIQLKSTPLSAWVPGLILAGVIIFGKKIPKMDLSIWDNVTEKLESSSWTSFDTGTNFFDQVILGLANIFEGEGGLIWTLLIGFLIVTLISLGAR